MHLCTGKMVSPSETARAGPSEPLWPNINPCWSHVCGLLIVLRGPSLLSLALGSILLRLTGCNALWWCQAGRRGALLRCIACLLQTGVHKGSTGPQGTTGNPRKPVFPWISMEGKRMILQKLINCLMKRMILQKLINLLIKMYDFTKTDKLA